MTVDVAGQTASLVLLRPKLEVLGQAAAIAIFPGTRVSVTGQAAFIAMFDTNPPPPAGRPRRIMTIIS